MQCPECGYMMTAFERTCPRCFGRGMGRPSAQTPPAGPRSDAAGPAYKECPQCRAVVVPDAPKCYRCGRAFQSTVPPPAAPGGVMDQRFTLSPPPPQNALATGSAAPLLPALLLCCVVCGYADTQKVAAICQSGTWGTHSIGKSVGMIGDGNGPEAWTVATTATRSRSQTQLASVLSPPAMPPVTTFGGLVALFSALLGLAALACLAYVLTDTAWFHWKALLTALALGGASVWLSISEAKRVRVYNAQVMANRPRWEEAMNRWNRMVYCPRCDHVCDPTTRAYAQSQGMMQIL